MVAALMALFATPNLAFSQGMMDGRERVVTPDELGRAIGKDLVHPYLYFSSDEVPELRERVESDPKSREIYKELLAEGKRLLYTPVEKQAPVADKNPRYSGNWDYHHYINRNREQALQLAFLYQLTGESKFAEKAFEFADVICDYKLWSYRAHEFPIIYSRVWPWGVENDQVVFSYDIRTGHTGYEMALI